ncbi:4-hydroxyproline epimerase [Collimonas sp. OK242]|jgi:4-hydroxyproline epimerase|uniref:4-hydroxyproline epimerase n=1 Tax=Collimonas sp. OK242 TaxID=1798195 RepID=UPI0008984B23|nr:4-hydroxyproline epimerase [Collimonas sp. OK242]SDX70971.1 4-hydroxyproline epimerase [Collimonas sp. OK242]
MKKISILDSHTGGEPTRLVLDGGPDLGGGPLSERLQILRSQHDNLRTAVVCEPRGSDVLVGALLCAPQDPACAAGVIFFNNVGYLGMCGHGTIGLIASLAYLGRMETGRYKIETPVGVVETELHDDGSVTVHNIPAYRLHKDVVLQVPGYGRVVGDIAWGGNWFFLIGEHGQDLRQDNIAALTDFSWAVRENLALAGITGANQAPIDHIELFAPALQDGNHSRNFVLCPGKAYDRSPCGTGTSAKIACLAADGKLAEGAVWRQESIIGSVFEASYRRQGEHILPIIRGSAHVNAESSFIFNQNDPFAWGIV